MEAAEEKHEIAKNKIKRELTKLWTGELAAVISFWVCFFYFKRAAVKYKDVDFYFISLNCIEFDSYSRFNILVDFVKEVICAAICQNKYKKDIWYT